MQLEEIEPQHESAFLEMIGDYKAKDPKTYASFYERKMVWDSAGFKAFVKECQEQRADWRPKAGKISVTRYVLLDENGKICGNGLMRFPLDDRTEQEGGNLQFDVPPSKRGNGYGTLVLNGMLFEAARAGLARALVTCNADHAAAVRAIEMNRGEFQDIVTSTVPGNVGNQVARYWLRLR